MTKLSLLFVLASVAAAGACKSAGMGEETRTAISAKMQSTQSPISACYETALTTNRKLKGMIMLDFIIEASSGQFKNVRTARNDLNDTPLNQCIIAEVEKQKLEKAPSSNVQVLYPLNFAPSN
jgi:hypothetical protein